MQPDEQLPPEGTAPVVPETTTEPAADMVPKAELERALADMHKYKSMVRDSAAKSAAEKEQLLREQNRWQELAELKAKEAEDYKAHLDKTREAMVTDKKFGAVREAALKAGIRPEAIADLELVGLDKVQVETTSLGRVNVIGVDNLIDSIKLSRPHWFGGQQTRVAGTVPNISSPSVVSLSELNKLSLEASKSGDYTAYEQKLKQYQKQRKV